MASGATIFVDTNVLVYAEDRAHADKHRAVRQWLRELRTRRLGRLSTQVLDEFYVTVTRRLAPAMPAGDARAEVRRFQRRQPWLVDHATVESAWAVESRFGLHFWDALMVASAQQQQGCRWLLTKDLQHDRKFDTVRVVNSFVVGPELLDAPAS